VTHPLPLPVLVFQLFPAGIGEQFTKIRGDFGFGDTGVDFGVERDQGLVPQWGFAEARFEDRLVGIVFQRY
jgi:hypothetical protein